MIVVDYYWYDPPAGWRYGFPAKVRNGISNEELEALLRKHNYPEKDIPLAMNHSRWWVAEERDVDVAK